MIVLENIFLRVGVYNFVLFTQFGFNKSVIVSIFFKSFN